MISATALPTSTSIVRSRAVPSPALREAAKTLGVITIATVVGATRQLPGTFVSCELINTEIVIPSSTDQNFGPNKYKRGNPIAAPIIVLIIRERKAIHAALASGSVTTITETRAQSGL